MELEQPPGFSYCPGEIWNGPDLHSLEVQADLERDGWMDVAHLGLPLPRFGICLQVFSRLHQVLHAAYLSSLPNAVHCHGEPRILNMPRHRLKDICTLADPGTTAGS